MANCCSDTSFMHSFPVHLTILSPKFLLKEKTMKKNVETSLQTDMKTVRTVEQLEQLESRTEILIKTSKFSNCQMSYKVTQVELIGAKIIKPKGEGMGTILGIMVGGQYQWWEWL